MLVCINRWMGSSTCRNTLSWRWLRTNRPSPEYASACWGEGCALFFGHLGDPRREYSTRCCGGVVGAFAAWALETTGTFGMKLEAHLFSIETRVLNVGVGQFS